MEIPPAGGHNGGDETVGGGDLHLPPPEHSRTVQCKQAHYGPVSGSGAATGAMGIQVVAGTGQGVCGGDEDSGLGGGTY